MKSMNECVVFIPAPRLWRRCMWMNKIQAKAIHRPTDVDVSHTIQHAEALRRMIGPALMEALTQQLSPLAVEASWLLSSILRWVQG